jgi:hypothetical protein
MRTAPCPNAPAVEVGGKDLIIPTDSSFKYLDRNTRQSSDCGGYGFLGAGSLFGTTTDYCWVLGSYNGFVGWVAVQSIEYQINGGWSSSLCTFFAKTPSLLVSDDGSATGCAQLTPDLVGDPEKGCFPADAVALLKGVGAVRMSDLALGDTVAVRRADGSVGFEPVYAFGHRDANITTVFAELSVAVGAQGSESTIQVRLSSTLPSLLPTQTSPKPHDPCLISRTLCVHTSGKHHMLRNLSVTNATGHSRPLCSDWLGAPNLREG